MPSELRRQRADVKADRVALRSCQAELKELNTAAPATDWAEAAEKARYLH